MRIKKAVIPAAGLGTRFLPATKSQPKEMFPLGSRPIIHYVVEGLIKAGIEEIIFITSPHKKALEDYFDRNLELEKFLEEKGKKEELDLIRQISHSAHFTYLRQGEARGNGHAILCAERLLKEPFYFAWGDDFFVSPEPISLKVIEAFEKYQKPVLALHYTDDEDDFKKYGFCEIEPIEEKILKIKDIIEKPGSNPPSNYAFVSEGILTPEIFPALKNAPLLNNELFLVSAMKELMKIQNFVGVILNDAKYYDCGNPIDYLSALLEISIQETDEKKKIFKLLKKILGRI